MAINWTPLYRKYKGLWIALKSDEKTVVGSGKTAKEAFKISINKGYAKPILTRMPSKIVSYIGFGV